MSITENEIVSELLDALDAFDQHTLPLGLYACEEFKVKEKPFPRLHQEWDLCLKPRLEALGCRPGRFHLRNGNVSFDLPDGTRAEMTVVRTSKIKVRKFGSGYRIDSHHKYQERWQELRLNRALSDLWKPSALADHGIGLHLFLFIGFAKEADPFGKELRQLDEQLHWNEHGAHYETRTWADREDRHFYVRLSAWSRENSEKED